MKTHWLRTHPEPLRSWQHSSSTNAEGRSRSIHSPNCRNTHNCHYPYDETRHKHCFVAETMLTRTSIHEQRAHRRRRSRASPKQGRAREDLIHWCHRRRFDQAAGNLTLDLLVLPLTGERPAVSSTPRSFLSHRRRGRPLAPPTETDALGFSSLNYSWVREFKRGRSRANQLSRIWF